MKRIKKNTHEKYIIFFMIYLLQPYRSVANSNKIIKLYIMYIYAAYQKSNNARMKLYF